MLIDFNLVEDVVVGDIDMRDYPDFSDAFLEEATYDGELMSDEMIDYINDNHSDWIHEVIFDEQLYF